jgi:deoxyribose-phosphate aldolase
MYIASGKILLAGIVAVQHTCLIMSKLYEKLTKQKTAFSGMKKCIREAEAAAIAGESSEKSGELFSFLDLTTLSCADNIATISRFCGKATEVTKRFPDIPAPAAVCTWPNFTHQVAGLLKGSGIKTVAVAGAFPSAQTFREVRVLETVMAAGSGADEIDIVISPGIMLTKRYKDAAAIVKELREASGGALLKVIIESGSLDSYESIYHASVIAMDAGADFVKTSTGKEKISATPEAAYVICMAIKKYYEETGIKVGFKPAGGISTTRQALIYKMIVSDVLGESWLRPNLFRIGASRLANDILSVASGDNVEFF